MNWTNERPTKPGWYWCRVSKSDTNPTIALIESHDDGLFVNESIIDTPVDCLDFQWAGPLEPPGELAFEVTDCRDCPFTKDNRDHGECFTYCNHPNANRSPYSRILWGCQGQFNEVPEWCPLGLGKG